MKRQGIAKIRRFPKRQQRPTFDLKYYRLCRNVRPHVIRDGQQIILEDRELLDRLEAYDREMEHGG